MNTNTITTKAELARTLNVSRTYVTLLIQGKRKPSKAFVDKLTALKLMANLGINTSAFETATFNLGLIDARPVRLQGTNANLKDIERD